MDVMQEDMVKLIQQHGEDLKDIAEFFEKNKALHGKENQVIQFSLDSGRNHVDAKNEKGKVDYKKIENKLFQVLDSFPGFMEINVTNSGIHFVLYSSDGGGEYVELKFLFRDTAKIDDNVPGLVDESDDYFKTAPRWYYEYSRPQG